MVRALVEPVGEGANRDPTCEQRLGDMSTGLAALAASRSRDKNHSIRHGFASFNPLFDGYRLVP